ncbi:hypothetical protein L1887_57781 [Cichorium endivia]|nr:hypothetical protein L1887_57781 [Cichorium endivia]
MSAVTTSNAAAAATSSSSSVNAQAPKPAVQASEVGWLFVTQYYTFLNQNPSRLHCFFTKKSTMVHGTEQEESSPCFGQQQIHDKITSLNFNDAKVFVSNVDTQSSASGGILVQVLGELSNNGAGWRKFAQTFFLAEQPNGYYVLNDIFRYLKDDDEIEAEAEAVDEAIQDEIDQADKDGVVVPHQLEITNITATNAVPSLPAPASKAIETAPQSDEAAAPAKPAESTESPAPAAVDEAVATSTAAEPTAATADEVGVDKKVTAVEAEAAPAVPKGVKDAAAAGAFTAAPAKAETAAAAPAAAPAQPSGPPKPKTWATLAASDATRWGSNVSTEAKGVSSSRPAPTPAAAAAKPAAKPASNGASSGGAASASVYIKNVVAEHVSESALRQALEAFGPLKDLTINAARSCAFADFATVDAARKAAAKGSLAVGKEWTVTVEERRKPTGAAGAARGGSAGAGAGRGGAGAGRGAARGAAPGRGGAARGRAPAS